MAETPATNWIDFWESQELFDERFLRKNLELFVERTESLLGYGRHQIVLDIGCGPGYLADLLQHRVKALCGVDTSLRDIAACRRRLGAVDNLRFEHVDHRSYRLPFPFAGEGYDLIVCQSVAQYLFDFTEVERLIRAAAEVAAPGAKLLISDLPRSQRVALDVASQLWYGSTRGFLKEVLRGFVAARFSDYRRLRRSPGVLTFPRWRLEGLAKRLGLDATIVERNLTVNASRQHLLVTF